ncbi:Amino Acid/Auxin Permease (AAAP) Family [Thraustotheca clavata]|uniref:Amino Acid/Auxin Permease (AAAP) Family n=1 Tax=Thraustotheca clavata TaxID=74557 RepID=A0A1V9ZLN8_9STRA|nr:Amino Acid/Auxin Permease (AAAP) Family [Thraustotheca clavata]
MTKGPIMTIEDLKAAFSLFCSVCGVGSLGLAGNYARAGYFWATFGFFFMAAANTYATWCISKVMLVAPNSVFTFGDLAEWSMGKPGRYVLTFAQTIMCTLLPIVFLVLGGNLLIVLFPNSFSQTTWIILMGITLLPVCLIPTLKEGAGAAAAGCLGTIFADGIALSLLITNMKDVNPTGISPPGPALGFEPVTTVFGNLALAYGAGIMIPTLQREHSDPTRMPRLILITMGVICTFFFLVSILGVFSTGCQTPSNLLFSVASSKLGFTADRGFVILAFLFMQLHVTIAFAVVIFPVFQIMERLVLRMHIYDNIEPSADIETPALDHATTSFQEDKDNSIHQIDPADAYKVPGAYAKAATLRTVMVIICVVIAVIWKDHLSALMDFVGASSSCTVCMILPILFYLKTFWTTTPIIEKVCGIIIVAVTVFLAIYVSINTGKELFAPKEPNPEIIFPFCAADYQRVVFTNTTHYNPHRALFEY